MKTMIYTSFLFLLLSHRVCGQYLHQDFESSSVVADYVNASPNNHQFNSVGSAGAGMQVAVQSGALTFSRTANTGSWTRTTDFSPLPNLLVVQFDLQVAAQTAAQTSAAVLQLGSGFSTNNSAEGTSLVHSRVAINFLATAGSFSLRNLGTSVNSAIYAGKQRITWVVNNAGYSQTYTGPNGESETVDDDKADIWIGNILELNEVGASTGTQPLTDLKFVFSAGTGSISFDNILVALPVNNISSLAASSIGTTQANANWLSDLQVTGYELELATDPLFINTLAGYNPLVINTNASVTTNFSSLSPSTNYYYRVRGFNQYGLNKLLGTYSAVQQFTTAAIVPGSISLSATNLTSPNFVQGEAGPLKSYMVSASLLSASLTITTDGLSEISLNETGPFTQSIQLTPTSGNISGTIIYVRFYHPSLGNILSQIRHESTHSPAQILNFSGKMLSAEPTVAGTAQIMVTDQEGVLIKVQPGNGNGRVLLVSDHPVQNSSPPDGIPQRASAIYGKGVNVDPGTFVVMAGSQQEVRVSGLLGASNYYVYVLEYNDQNVPFSVNYLVNWDAVPCQTVAAREGLILDQTNKAFVVNFDDNLTGVNNGKLSGSGSAPIAPEGGLYSKTWSITGWSLGNVPFGSRFTLGPVASGSSTADIKVPGIYAYQTSPSNVALGIQATRNEFDPGQIILKVKNNCQVTIRQLEWKYRLYQFNDQPGAMLVNCFYSYDGVNYTPVTDLNAKSDESPDAVPAVKFQDLSALLDISLDPDAFIYLKWRTSASTTAWDEVAIDDISLTANPIDPVVLPLKLRFFQAEDIGRHAIRIKFGLEDLEQLSKIILQHSIDGKQFENIASFDAVDDGEELEFVHDSLTAGMHYYRLVEDDQLQTVISDVLQVKLGEAIPLLTVYPNPATGFIWIELNGFINAGILKIINATGQVVLSRQLSNAINWRGKIDLEAFAAGWYVLELVCERGAVRKILLIQY